MLFRIDKGASARMLTLFTDASHCHFTRAAGYGAWAKATHWSRSVTFGGSLPRCGSSSEAEIIAIAYALAKLRLEQYLVGVRTIMIQSDSLRALDVIAHDLGAIISNHLDGASVEYRANLVPNAVERAAIQTIMSARGDATLMVRHVRGHTEKGSRERVNARCDRIAYRHMRGQRQRARA